MALDYDVVMRRKKDDFCMYIPELSIIASGKDVGEAFQNLVSEKERYLRSLLEFDLQDTIPEPAIVNIRQKQYQELRLFAFKTLIFLILSTLVLVGLFLPIYTSFQRTIITLPDKAATGVLTRIEGKLNAMTDKDREDMRLRVKKVVNGLKPYSDEIKVLFQDEKKGYRAR